MNLLVWVVVATAISLCGGVGMLVFKQQRKRKTLRPWEPWAYALGLQPSLALNGGVTLKGNFENIPVILTSAGFLEPTQLVSNWVSCP